MKIDYVFNNGDVSEVEVSEEIGKFIIESRKAEFNNNRRHKSHNTPLSEFCYEGEDFAAFDDFSYLESNLTEAFSDLTQIEKQRIMKYASGFTMDQIAKQEGVNKNAVFKSIREARAKIKKYL